MSDFNGDPERYRPITMWGYFGLELLFSIPIVGFIFLVVFALGGTRNINKRNFARSYFCYFIICVVIVAVLVATGLSATAIGMLKDLIAK